jgi:hypothetical protein
MSKSSAPKPPRDTPATRKHRLQQRLQELDAQNEREMNALARSIERIKATFRRSKAQTSTPKKVRSK